MRRISISIFIIAVGAAAFVLVSRHRTTQRSFTVVSTPAQVASTETPSVSNARDALLAEAERSATDNKLGREITKSIRVLRLDSAHSDRWVRLGDALRQRSRDTLDASLYAIIKKIYFQAYHYDATNTDALIGLAWAAGATHRFDDSIKWAELALKLDSNLSSAHGLLGDAAVEVGRYDEASQHYQKMLDLRPDMGSYSRAAHLLYLQGNVSRATALMRKAIDAGGSHPEHTAWCVAELATMLCHEGATVPALQLVESSLKQAPDNIQLLAAAGHARMVNGDDTGAISAYERAVAISPQHGSLVALHDLYLAAGRTEDTQRTAERVRHAYLVAKSQRVFGGEGPFAHFLADRGDSAEEAVRLAQEEFGHHHTAMAADTLAWALHRAGRSGEAKKLLSEMLKHRVPDPVVLYHAGMIEDAAGNAPDARQHLAAALSRSPRFNPVHAPLAQAALVRLGAMQDGSGIARHP